MKNWIAIAIAFCLFGCDNDVDPADNTVHLAGHLVNSSGGSMASYWKDGVHTALVGDSPSSRIASLYVDGSTVFIGGAKFGQGTPTQSLIWRDGIATVLEGVSGEPMIVSRNNNLFGVWHETFKGEVFHKNGVSQPIVDTAHSFGTLAMTLNGEDIYSSGYSSGPGTAPNYSPPQHAQYWKNGQLIFRENEVSNGLSIFIHDNEVYMAGHVYKYQVVNSSVASYWKNGQLVKLSEEGVSAVARSIFVTDAHVYVAGMRNNQAVYWKDGNEISLTSSGTDSMANSIFVVGDDVHVGGYQDGYPAYWKNGLRQDIENQDRRGQVLFVVVGSN